jgi:HAD superfamily hydrolase (TIGR01484 family)
MKILGSDYDGTFALGGIGEAKLSAVSEWRKAGNKFGIISGRRVNFLQELLQEHPKLELDFFAACSGAYIVDSNKTVIYQACCSSVSVASLVTDLISWGAKSVHITYENKDLNVFEKMEDIPPETSKTNSCLLKDMPYIECFHQVTAVCATLKESTAVVKQIQNNYGQWLNPLYNGYSIDIVDIGVNKAQGLYRVMEFFGGSYNDVIAVGDNINDAEMIREFYSYAMENAPEQIRSLANCVVSDVTELLEKELVMLSCRSF